MLTPNEGVEALQQFVNGVEDETKHAVFSGGHAEEKHVVLEFWLELNLFVLAL